MTVAGLVIRGALKAGSVETGFRADSTLLIEADASLSGYEPARSLQLYRAATDRLAGLPGVEAASIASRLPSPSSTSCWPRSCGPGATRWASAQWAERDAPTAAGGGNGTMGSNDDLARAAQDPRSVEIVGIVSAGVLRIGGRRADLRALCAGRAERGLLPGADGPRMAAGRYSAESGGTFWYIQPTRNKGAASIEWTPPAAGQLV